MRDNRFTKYNATLGVFLLLAMLTLGFSYLFLFFSNETMAVDTIAKRQQTDGFLYLSALSDKQLYLYKLSLYSEIKPPIVALGSSRVLQFRGEDFKVPFVNMGLAMSSIKQGNEVVDQMLKMHVPKFVILGADFWWFSEKDKTPGHIAKIIDPTLDMESLLMPYKWIGEKKLTFELISKIIFSKRSGYGLGAIVWQDGYDKFGSFHYTSMLEGKREPNHIPINVSDQIHQGKDVQSFQDKFDPDKMRDFKLLINKFVSAGSKVIVIIPPNYPDVNNLIENDKNYNLVSDFRNAIHGIGTENFDFQDANLIESDKCEFIDSWHGGEVTYLRILRNIASNDKDISNIIDSIKIDKLISENKGRAEIMRSNYPIKNEMDFFGLGCKKGAN